MKILLKHHVLKCQDVCTTKEQVDLGVVDKYRKQRRA
jgi:hypothetical protein